MNDKFLVYFSSVVSVFLIDLISPVCHLILSVRWLRELNPNLRKHMHIEKAPANQENNPDSHLKNLWTFPHRFFIPSKIKELFTDTTHVIILKQVF